MCGWGVTIIGLTAATAWRAWRTEPYAGGVLGDVILVNGAAWPYAEVTRARYRLRLLNASDARRYRLVPDPPPPGGGGLVQIGTDGGLLARPLTHDAIEISRPAVRRRRRLQPIPARRNGHAGQRVRHRRHAPRAPVPARRAAVRDNTSVLAQLSTTAPPPARRASAQAIRTRTFPFQGGLGAIPRNRRDLGSCW
jgi:spore coat protein A